MSLASQKSNIAVIIATFAFTMLGFLAAVITILFSFSSSGNLKKYKRLGYLPVFFSLYYTTIACLIITFITSLIMVSALQSPWPLRLSIIFTVNNLFQIGLLTTAIVNISQKAIDEED